WASSSRCSTISRSCAARPTSTSAPDVVARRPRLAVTLGDPRGIGPEVVARALASGPLDAEVTVIGADDQVVDLRADAKVGIGVWNTGRGEKGEVPSADRSVAVRRSEPLPSPFSPEALAGRLAGQAVERAVQLARDGNVDAVVTGPVHKHALHLAGFRYPGLTEFLAHLAGDRDVAMMLTTRGLRVVLVTTHLPLRDVPRAVTTERVVRTGRITGRPSLWPGKAWRTRAPCGRRSSWR